MRLGLSIVEGKVGVAPRGRLEGVRGVVSGGVVAKHPWCILSLRHVPACRFGAWKGFCFYFRDFSGEQLEDPR